MESIRRDFRELGFVVIATPEDHIVEFTVYEIEGEEANGHILFHKRGSGSHPDPVDTIEESEPYLSGSVKWDGCSNWHFDEQNRVMLHFCSRIQLLQIGELLAACYDMAKEVLPHSQLDWRDSFV